jgi:thioredoxin-like negative regulator of GroEL
MLRAMRRALALVVCGLVAGCSRSTPGVKPDEGPRADRPGVVSAPSGRAHLGALPFIEDDYARALGEARRRGVPIFVDAWAPWCHTCLSLRAYVLGDVALADLADRFVWLAIDTEREQNAAFLARYPIEVWPTLLVIDPAREAAVMKWPGSLTTPELRGLLEDGDQAVRHRDTGGEAGARLIEAEQAVAAGKRDDAVKAYRASLAAAPAGWPRRARAVDGLQSQLARLHDDEGCAKLAAAELPSMPPGTSAANVGVTWLACARQIKGDAGRAEAERAASQVERLARDAALPILADDRSSLFEELVDFRKEAGDAAGAKRASREWGAFLEAQAAAARDPSSRAVFDAHRQLADAAMGDPGRSLPMLEKSARESPADYNAAARLAKVYLDLKRTDDALGQVDRALSLAYGPRRMRLFSLKATILVARGDRPAARAALAEGIKLGESMTLTGSYARVLEGLRKKLSST